MKGVVIYGDSPRANYELLKSQIIPGELKAGRKLKMM